MEQPQYIVQMNNIYKSFNGVKALKDVSINLQKNEVVGIVGHNGAGKSTLIKILSGALHKDTGSILIENKLVEISDPKDARNMGIETIYQDLALAGNLDVASNFFLGNEKTKFFFLEKQIHEGRVQKGTARNENQYQVLLGARGLSFRWTETGRCNRTGHLQQG